MKKAMTLMLAISMAVGINVTSFAAPAEGKGMENAIVETKKSIDIPEKYSEFNYSSYNDSNTGKTFWTFEWKVPDKNDFISVEADENGSVIRYQNYSDDNYSSKEGLAKTNKDYAKSEAGNFLQKIRPEKYKNFKEVTNDSGFDNDVYSFTYQLYENDIPVKFEVYTIEVSKNNGKILNFYSTSSRTTKYFDGKYTDAKGVITLNEAKKAYLENVGVKLKYYYYYDYNKNEKKVFPAYSINDDGYSYGINAKTGKSIKLYNNMIMYSRGGFTEESMKQSLSADSGLTKEEISGIENINNLIGKDKAASIIKNASKIIGKDNKATSSSLTKDNFEKDRYSWNINFENGSGSVNAKTGEIFSFYSYDDSAKDENSGKISYDDALKTAKDFSKNTSNGKFEKTSLDEKTNKNLNSNIDINYYIFNFTRQENGIDVNEDGISVMIDKNSGNVLSYNCTWSDSVSFPTINNSINSSSALDSVIKINDFKLFYTFAEDEKVYPVYCFENNDNIFIDPISGKRIDRTGAEYSENDKYVSEYNDIKGHWAEKMINALLENGYYISGEKFNPDTNINQLSFLKYLYSNELSYLSDEELYKELIERNVLTENEKNPKEILTKKEAAKIIASYLGYSSIGDKNEIFINPYKDSVEDKYKGYAAICYGLGIISADEKGNFNGDNEITNANAANIIYNMLKVKK